MTKVFMDILNKTIAYGLYLLAFLLPLQTRWIIKAGELEYSTFSLYGTDILLILLLAMFAIYVIASDRRERSNPWFVEIYRRLLRRPEYGASRNDRAAGWLILGLLAMAFISVFFAPDKVLALYKFGWLIMGAGLFWLAARAEYNKTWLVWSLLSGLALQSVLAVWQFLTQLSFANKWLGLAAHNAADLGASVIEIAGAAGAGERWLRAYGGMDHPNILGGALAIGILLLAGQMMKNFQSKILKIFNWLFLILLAAALFFSFSRAAWLGLAAGLTVMLGGAAIRRDFRAQKNILQAVLVSGLLFFILFFQFSDLALIRLYGGGRLEVKSTNERLESIKNSWPLIKKNWASGLGLGNYTLALERELPGRENYFYQPAHNVFLLVWSETGIIGFILFICLILYFIILNFLSAGRQVEMIINLGILISLVVLLSFDHWLWSLHFGVLFFWLMTGLTLGRPAGKIAENDKPMIS
ncbi:MAG: O-antigen ligase family protein [bacterium]|nr:O-antigen ligase family protein [bacterium]